MMKYNLREERNKPWYTPKGIEEYLRKHSRCQPGELSDDDFRKAAEEVYRIVRREDMESGEWCRSYADMDIRGLFDSSTDWLYYFGDVWNGFADEDTYTELNKLKNLIKECLREELNRRPVRKSSQLYNVNITEDFEDESLTYNEFMDMFREINDTMSFEGRSGYSFQRWCAECLGDNGKIYLRTHPDWVRDAYEDYINLTES